MVVFFSPLFKSSHGFSVVMKPHCRMGLDSRNFWMSSFIKHV